MSESNVIIVGAGPAGMSAAIQLTRMGYSVIVFEKAVIGGLLKNARQIDNYLGLRAQSGKQLIDKFKEHLEHYQVLVIREKVSLVNYEETEARFIVQTPTQQFKSKYLIIASGTNALSHDLEKQIPKELRGIVHHEVHPLSQLRNEKVLIIGGGDAAFDYALNLSENQNDVTILHNTTQQRCLAEFKNQVLARPEISILADYEISDMQATPETMPPEATLVLQKDGGTTTLENINQIIIAIGRIPEKSFLSPDTASKWEKLEKNKLLFWAGDVKGGRNRQTAIACGDGIKAALEIDRKESENN